MSKVSDLMATARLYESVTPQFGPQKKLVVTVLCDGVEMSISSTAGAVLDRGAAERELGGKLEAFLENRPGSVVEAR